ncbi:hypothetical protein F4780DRAFT_728855 [Xylariomycetidae sp. FL0641]|nr:hypothetical protein F4780DRAFT_728855 [Xylariomycetidae sp. FL0641]
MVSLKSLLATALAAVPVVSGYVYDFSAPATAAAGSSVSVTMETAIYIQNWVDYGIVWGLAPTAYGGTAADGTIMVGTQIGYEDLVGFKQDPTSNSFDVQVAIPSSQPAGEWSLVAAIPYLVGASGLVQVHAFNHTIQITEA